MVSYDRCRNRVFLAYDQVYILAQVVDPIDQRLLLWYDDYDHIVQVSDSLDRIWNYEYDDGSATPESRGDLKSVCTPAVLTGQATYPNGKKHTFVYEKGSNRHKLRELQDQRGISSNLGPLLVTEYDSRLPSQ